jgi:putative colanic acid biosynthesis UDP-glucose lipid carrier transferase
VKPKPIRDWGYVMKLVLDYVLGGISLVFFGPLMLMAALAIKLESRGPVLFKQRRHGYNHRVIHVYKFRTMRVAEDGPVITQARKDDERITRVGRLLRRTSIDELPQLFNVLRGEMSLVGPRPHAVAHNQHYRERLARYANRHCVKPGMTGWAQIHGFRGPTEDPEKMRKRVEMDLYYIENWSIWLDLKIIAATPLLGFIHRNAI